MADLSTLALLPPTIVKAELECLLLLDPNVRFFEIDLPPTLHMKKNCLYCKLRSLE